MYSRPRNRRKEAEAYRTDQLLRRVDRTSRLIPRLAEARQLTRRAGLYRKELDGAIGSEREEIFARFSRESESDQSFMLYVDGMNRYWERRSSRSGSRISPELLSVPASSTLRGGR